MIGRERRTTAVLVVLIVSLVVSGIAVHGSATASSHGQSFAVEQGDRCYEIEPMTSDATVEEFYDYRTHSTHPNASSRERAYGSYGTTHLQESDVSTLFLHEGSDGISLVIVHDSQGSATDGGAATFEIVGLPKSGEWVVEDDSYRNAEDEFIHGDVWSEMTWNWRNGRTDGAAFNGGLDSFEITIYPAFGNAAEFQQRDGRIEDWQALSGGDSPDRHSLGLNDRVVVRSGTCDDPRVAYDRSDGRIVADIAGASPDDSVHLRPPPGPNNSSAEYHRVSYTPSRSGEVTMTLDATEEPPGVESASELEGVTALSYLSMDASDGGESVESGVVTFSVRKDQLDEDDVDPTDVGLYARVDGSWEAVPTDPAGETNETYRFEAQIDAPTTVAVGIQRPSISLTDVTLDRTTIVEGEEVALTATVENRGHAPGTYTIDLEVFGERVDSADVTVGAFESETVRFTQRIDSPGTYTIAVNDANRTVTVEAETSAETTSEASSDQTDAAAVLTSNGAITAAILAALLFIALRRRL